MKFIPVLLLTFSSFFVLTGCNSSIEASIGSDGTATFQMSTALLPSLHTVLGGALKAAEISKTLLSMPAVQAASFSDTSSTSFSGSGTISDLNRFLSIEGAAKCISLSTSGGRTRLSIALDRDTAPGLVSLLSLDMQDYLSVLVPPILMGTTLSQAAYLAQLSTMGYSKALTGELQSAKISLKLSLPANVVSVNGGTFSGKTAEFSLPILDLMVLDKPVKWEIVW
jgi:hypothetical protein